MRRTTTLALPGDEDDVLDFLIRDALHREQRLSPSERMAYQVGQECAKLNIRYRYHGGAWQCDRRRVCAWCAQLK